MTPRYQGSDAWLAERKGGIGASDVPILVQGSAEAWRDLFMVKLGRLPDPPATEAMAIGKRLEELIAALYTERTGHRVQRVDRVLHHREHDFIRASLDRKRRGTVIELKARSYRSDEWGREGSDQVPDSLAYQVNQQMLVAGVDRADVAVLFSGRELRVYELGADAGVQAELIELESRAWAYIRRRQIPPYPGAVPVRPILAEGEIEADAELAARIENVFVARRQLATQKEELEGYEAQLKELIGEYVGVQSTGLHLSYRPNRDTTKVAWELVAKAYRQRLLEHRETPAFLDELAGFFTTSEPGNRPLRITAKKPSEELIPVGGPV